MILISKSDVYSEISSVTADPSVKSRNTDGILINNIIYGNSGLKLIKKDHKNKRDRELTIGNDSKIRKDSMKTATVLTSENWNTYFRTDNRIMTESNKITRVGLVKRQFWRTAAYRI